MSLFYFIIIIISPFNFAFFVDYFKAQRISAYTKHKQGADKTTEQHSRVATTLLSCYPEVTTGWPPPPYHILLFYYNDV